MTGRYFAVVGLVAVFISGCSLQPTYERPAAPIAGSFPSGPAYKSAQRGQAGTTLPAVDLGWRDFLRDARLQRLVEISLANNRDLRVAMLNVEQVRAQYRIQRAALFPQVGAFADASRVHTPAGIAANGAASTTQVDEVGVSASWEIDFFGRLRSLNDAALQQYFASGYARQAAEILLVSQVADQYLTLLAFDEQLQVTRETAKTAQAS
jgi:outer membrane protein, multidrug efflux system